MNTEDNIKKFFVSRLKDSNPEEDLWNIPSDDIWFQAKEHFPKKKKRRRPFIFFLFGTGIFLLLTIAGLFYWTGKDAGTEIVATESYTTPMTEIEQTKRVETAITKEASEAVVQITEEEIFTKQETKNKGLTAKSNETKVTPLKSEQKIIASNVVLKEDSKPEQLNNSIISSKELIQKSENIKQENSNTKVDERDEEQAILLPVEQLPILSSLVETDKSEALDMEYKIIKPKRIRRRWEIGLSHSPFILNFKKIVEDREPGQKETLALQFNYQNLNIPITRRFNRRWSLTSGVSYAHIDLKLDFTVEEAYDVVPTDADFRKVLDETIPAGNLTINDASRDLGVMLTDDADVQNGDTLLFKGAIPLKLNLVQVPILVNYHFGKGKFEGLLHTGVSLDYFIAEVDEIDFEIFKDDNLISEPIDFVPLKDAGLDLSIYAGMGVKYHINDRWNLGFSTKFHIPTLLLSRHEIGVYYGF